MKILGKAALLLALLCVITGLIYPMVVTGIANVAFKEQSGGSIIEIDGVKYGSELLGQQFTDMNHLWGRVMNVDTGTYTDDEGNAMMYAAPSNKSPAGEDYESMIKERVKLIRDAHPDKADEAIPVDLVTCSGSGLDPEISPAAAEYQVSRIAANSDHTEDKVRAIIAKYTKGRFLGLFGEPAVNVLKVNLALDGILK